MVSPAQDQEPSAQPQAYEPRALPDVPPDLPEGPPPLPDEPAALAKEPPRIPDVAEEPPSIPRGAVAPIYPVRSTTVVGGKRLIAAVGVLGLVLIIGGVLYFKTTKTKRAEEPLPASTLEPPSVNLTQEEYRALRRKELDEMRTTDPARYKREVDFLQQHDPEEWQQSHFGIVNPYVARSLT